MKNFSKQQQNMVGREWVVACGERDCTDWVTVDFVEPHSPELRPPTPIHIMQMKRAAQREACESFAANIRRACCTATATNPSIQAAIAALLGEEGASTGLASSSATGTLDANSSGRRKKVSAV